MSKILYKNYIFIIVIAFIMSFSLGYFATNNGLNEEELTPDRAANYDKMKISYARIVERKTGTAPFSDVPSDNDGHDASESDEYVRTHDQVLYTLEVGIDRNEATTQPTDSFSGGIIKVKVTIPVDTGEKAPLLLQSDAWGKGVSYNSTRTEMTAYYSIPEDKQIAGGNQQLSFLMYVNGYEKLLTGNKLPKFEIWMEGNKPDNSNSEANSIVVQDNDNIQITGNMSYGMNLYEGTVFSQTRLDGVKGQFISFIGRVVSGSGKGDANPSRSATTNIKMEYYYRDVDSTSENEWTKIEDELPNDPLYGSYLYSYGRTCEDTPGFWPNSSSNKSSISWYWMCSKYSGSTYSNDGWVNYDSGQLTASFENTLLSYTHENFYKYTNGLDSRYSTVTAAGFEYFIPYYEPEQNKRYQYKVVFTDNYLKTYDDDGNEYSKNPNSTLTFTFKNYTDNIFHIDLFPAADGGIRFNELKPILMGPLYDYRFLSTFNAYDGLYEGGFDRLITWNTAIAELSKSYAYEAKYNPYNSSTPVPSTANDKVQYGIYKYDRENGTASNALANSANFDDFDWYDNREEAESHGVISALKHICLGWRGYDMPSYFTTRLTMRVDENNLYNVGIVRHKFMVYTDSERNHGISTGTGTYNSSILNNSHTGISILGNPTNYGESYVPVPMLHFISISSNKSNYNVEEEYANITVSPRFTALLEYINTSSFIVTSTVPKDLKYVDGSANVEPTNIVENSNGTTQLTWNFSNVDLHSTLPTIRYKLELSPYIPNSSSKTVSASISSSGFINSESSSVTFTVTNLSGQSIREKFDNAFLNKDEETNFGSTMYNIAQRRLEDFKTIEILPKNGDSLGTNYNGSYTIDVLSLSNDQRMFYTTSSINEIGLVEDSVGKKHLSIDENFSSSIWHEVHVGDTIPFDVTAIATQLDELSAVSDVSFNLKFIPTGNTYGDTYYFQIIGSSDSLENAVSSEVKRVSIVDRKISGKVFFDNNRDGIYNSGDTLLANKNVYLYDENNQLITTMTTDANGYYEGEHFERGNYYIKYVPETGQEFVTKNVGAATVSSVVNPDGASDIIQEFSQNPAEALIHKQNMNIGLQYKQAQVVVHHYVKNTTDRVHDDVVDNAMFNDSYTAEAIASEELYEDYKNLYYAIESTKTVTVENEIQEIILYYEPTPATIVTHHYKVGTSESVFPDVSTTEYFGNTYHTTRISTSDYVSAGEAGDPTSALVTRSNYEVIYYYAIPKATVVTHHYISGTTTKVHDDDREEFDYNTEYNTRTYATADLYETYQNKYFYIEYHTGDAPSGVVNKSNYEVNYYYNVKESTILVHHYIKNTTTPVHADQQFTKRYGEDYQTSYFETDELEYEYRDKYFFNSSEGDARTGVVNKANYEIIYYYGVQNATITVHHYLEGTTTKVHEDDVISKMFFESYSTSPYNPGDLVSPYTSKYYYNNKYSGDSRSGIVGKTSYEVIYYYELREAEIITHYYKLGTEDKVQDSKIMYKKFTQEYNTRPLETEELYNRYRNVYIYSNEICESNNCDAPTGIVSKDKYIVIYYYVPREATVTTHHLEISKDGNRTTNKVAPDVVDDKHFTDEYTTRNLESSELTGNFKDNYYYTGIFTGTRAGTVDTDNVEVTYYYEAKPAKVVVHHYVEGTTDKVHADDVMNKVYTDTYETRALNTDELIGDYKNNYYYHGHRVGDAETDTISKDNYEITYYYELRPSTITIHHLEKGTTNKVHNDDVITDKKYTEVYNIVPYEPSSLTGTYQNNYHYNGEHEGDSLSDIISKDSYEITIYYEPIPSTVIVRHYLVDTINKVHEDDVINTFYGKEYTTKSYETGELDNPYKNVYSYNNTNGGDVISGTINKDNYEVIYYYDFRPATLTVHHYIIGTETKVHEDQIYDDLHYMGIYQTTPLSTNELEGEYANWYEYKTIKEGDQPNGQIIGDSYEITYYYDKIPATLTVHHYITDTEEKIAEDDVIELKLKDHYETSPKADNELNKLNYTYDLVVGDASGTIEETEREVVYYYKLKEAQLIVRHLAEDTKENLCVEEIEDVTYQDFYTTDSCTDLNDINYTYKEVVTNDPNSEQRGTKVMGNILQDVVEVTYYYELKPGQIVVHYFEVGTRERVTDDVISDGLAGKEFISEAKTVDGFTLVSKPESNVHIYEEDTQEVIYEYERNTYRIGVEVIGGVGSITGSEDVPYGSDSTEGNIVITPSEGYEIEKVLIDGEEIDIEDLTGMTLENFKKVSSDHKVEVEFSEKPLPVPITGKVTRLILIALISLAFSIVAYLYAKSSRVLNHK